MPQRASRGRNRRETSRPRDRRDPRPSSRASSSRARERGSASRPRPGRDRSPVQRPRPRLGASPEKIERILDRQPWSILDPVLLELGADVAAVRERLRVFARLVLGWNASASNLISRNDEARIVERHLYESIAPARLVRDVGASRWIDLGSGAGFPAIPLAIAGIRGSWTLVESRRTKTLFMRKTITEMELQDFVVENSRLEELVDFPAYASSFDGFISRATMRLGPTLDLAARVIAPGGSALLWKGSGLDLEMKADRSWESAWYLRERSAIGSGPVTVVQFVRKPTE